MKRPTALLIALTVLGAALQAQNPKPVKIARGADYFYYQALDYGQSVDTHYTVIETDNNGQYLVTDGQFAGKDSYAKLALRTNGSHIPGCNFEDIIVRELFDSICTQTTILTDGRAEYFRTDAPYSRSDIQFDSAQVGKLVRYTCSINSNKLEFYYQPHPRDITPVPHYGRHKGLLVSYWRNGQCQLQLVRTERKHNTKFCAGGSQWQRVTPRQLSSIKRQRMVVTTRIFDSVQLSWGQPSSQIKDNNYNNVPFDSVLHFAGGTLALKRINLPELPAHYQTFVEIHQRSNGDAYDRTGSLFVLDDNLYDFNFPSFLQGIIQHPDSLPAFTARNGQRYQGIRIEGDSTAFATDDTYYPPLELVRFFTSFGIDHFNDRVQIDGLEWQRENYFKQEVTDLSIHLQGEEWVGIWIGNYDAGGHIVTVDLKSYPNDTELNPLGSDSLPQQLPYVRPLFNTCNVLEMAGQNYGTLFDADSLSATFHLPAYAKNARLRYISTGHGGWDGGDEFNPKPNTILIDGKPIYTYTPWRCDCGRYREWNPVSGNFWNGMSSSDFSRSGWCPGTATQPVYFDLSFLTPGPHTITVAIPQGQPQEGSFSHWCVSGALIFEE